MDTIYFLNVRSGISKVCFQVLLRVIPRRYGVVGAHMFACLGEGTFFWQMQTRSLTSKNGLSIMTVCHLPKTGNFY